MKGEGWTLERGLRVARIGTLILAGAMLCWPGLAQTPKHGKRKASTASPAKSAKVIKTSTAKKTAASGGAKKTVVKGKSSARGRSKRASSRASRREKGQKAPTADRIIEIQQALGKNGSYRDHPSGKWDSSTVEAVRKFQAGRGLNPSGKLDAKTLQQLGLGSSTAGMAPPAPLVSSVDRLTSSNSQVGQRR